MPSRTEVFEALDEERRYQELRWPGHKHTPTEFLVYIQHYVTNAMARATNENGEHGALDAIRKIGALAVAAMEENGAPRRNFREARMGGKE